jgi:hypothetical protein
MLLAIIELLQSHIQRFLLGLTAPSRQRYGYKLPHQNLNGKTPAKVWCGINPYAKPPKQEQWFEA